MFIAIELWEGIEALAEAQIILKYLPLSALMVDQNNFFIDCMQYT